MAHVRKQVISLFLTAKCNLRCAYCYTKKSMDLKPEHQTMDFNFAKLGIIDFFREYPSRLIRFYGSGEPTQEFELLKSITEFAYSLAGDSLKVELQTNGLFSEKIAEWVSENVDIVWISSDGPSEIQDKNRPTKGGKTSHEVVFRNLRYFVDRSKHNKMQVGVRATITADVVTRQVEIIEHFHEMGVRFVNAHPACITIDENHSGIFNWDPKTFAEYFYAAHQRGKELGVYYNSLYIANFDEYTRHFCRANIPYPHLTTDGYVSCCDFAQFGPEYDNSILQKLIYGKYLPNENRIEYDEEKIYKIRLRNADNLKKTSCKDCSLAYNCGGGCVGQALLDTDDMMGIHKDNCAITKLLGEKMPLNKGLAPVLHS